MRALYFVVCLNLLGLGCEEAYTECHADRAPSDFPPPEDRASQCQAVCDHFEGVGCRLGCPFLPDGGLDAGVRTSDLECWASCLEASDTILHPEVIPEAITRALRCYAGTETCRQIGACSRLCGEEGGAVWPNDLLCVESSI